MLVDGAVFAAAFGFVMAGTAAAFGGGVAGDLVKQGFSAVGDSALDNFEGAAFTDGGSGLPVRVDGERADFAQAGGRELAECF
jgi:hypothetical protein